MKIFFTLFLIAISAKIAQSQEMLATAEGLTTFLNSTLYVPVTGNVLFDEALQKGFSKYWKITPYKFVEQMEFKKMEKINDKDLNKHVKTQPKAFLFTWERNRFEITDICYAYTFEYGDESLTKSKWIDDSDYFAKSKNFDNVRFRMEYIIKAMNDMITITKDEKLGDDESHEVSFLKNPESPRSKKQASMMHQQLSLLINKKANTIKDKILILNKNMEYAGKAVYSEEAFAKNYPYPYKFVSDSEFKEILKGEQTEYVCFVPVYWQAYTGMEAFEFVYEPSTRSTIYMELVKFTKVKKEDIDLLKKAIAH